MCAALALRLAYWRRVPSGEAAEASLSIRVVLAELSPRFSAADRGVTFTAARAAGAPC
jgi:hypothetical protein